MFTVPGAAMYVWLKTLAHDALYACTIVIGAERPVIEMPPPF